MDLVETPDGWVEVNPKACPACGHPGPGWALVGSHRCRLHLHRTHWCKRCHAETFNPPLTDVCRDVHVGFDETSQTR